MAQEIEDLIRQVAGEVKQKMGGNTVTFQQIIASSSDKKKVEDWSLKDFFHYYTSLYEKAVKQKYLITYSTDLTNLKTLKSIFVKHTMDTDKNNFKKFLDWCFDNRELIFKDSGNFLITTLRRYINRYVSDIQDENEVAPKDIDFLNKLRDKAKKTNKFSDMLKIYGIPIMTTYMMQASKRDEEYVTDRIDKIIRTQYESKNISDLRRIAKQSLVFSPYPEFFGGLDWRHDYVDIWEDLGIMEEDWWRQDDYAGKPAEHYQELKVV